MGRAAAGVALPAATACDVISKPECSFLWDARQKSAWPGVAVIAPDRVSVGSLRTTTWTAPDGTEVLVRVEVTCPNCDYPILVQATEGMLDRGVLNVILRCSGHWRIRNNGRFVTDEHGRVQRMRCGWSGVIAAGVAHAVDCEAVRGGGACSCQPRLEEAPEDDAD